MKGDKRKLRAINDGTAYAIDSNIIKLGRDIRDGKYGRVRDVIVILRYYDKDNDENIATRVFGTMPSGAAMMMLKAAEKKIL